MYELMTARLGLKKMTPDEAPVFFELNSDPEVVKYTGDGPFESLAAAEQFFIDYQEVYRREGYGRFSVYWLETGECVGWCGLRYQPDLDKTDLGYRLMKRWWGRGIATEASEVCLKFGFEQLGLSQIVARAMGPNLASIAVMKKLGMQYLRAEEFDQHSGVLYGIERADWEALHQTKP